VIPEDLRFTEAHEWVGATAGTGSGTGGTVRVGITDYAQRQLGDVVFIQLPEVGQRITAGEAVGEIESTKSVSDLFAPVSGEVVSVNEALVDQPELVNAEPYGAGWVFEVRTDEPAEDAVRDLLDAEAYRSLTDRS
jgi:glycine cleavage system H protein